MTEACIYGHVRPPRGRGNKGLLHGRCPSAWRVGLIDALRRHDPNLDPSRLDSVVAGVVSQIGNKGWVPPGLTVRFEEFADGPAPREPAKRRREEKLVMAK